MDESDSDAISPACHHVLSLSKILDLFSQWVLRQCTSGPSTLSHRLSHTLWTSDKSSMEGRTRSSWFLILQFISSSAGIGPIVAWGADQCLNRSLDNNVSTLPSPIFLIPSVNTCTARSAQLFEDRCYGGVVTCLMPSFISKCLNSALTRLGLLPLIQTAGIPWMAKMSINFSTVIGCTERASIHFE